MTTQVAKSPTISTSRTPVAGRGPRTPRLRKKAYSVVRRLMGRGRFRPWLDCTVIELFQTEAGDLRQNARMPRTYTSRWATPDDAVGLGEFFGSPVRVQQRLARGDACALVLAGERICAGAWLAIGPAIVEEDWNDVQCRYRVPAGTVWGYDGRGTKLGAWGCLMLCLPDYLDELGAERMVVGIHYNNHLSINSHLSAGFHSVGWIGCIRFLGLVFRACRPAGGRWHCLPGQLGPVEVS